MGYPALGEPDGYTHAVLVQGVALQQGCTFFSYAKGILA